MTAIKSPCCRAISPYLLILIEIRDTFDSFVVFPVLVTSPYIHAADQYQISIKFNSGFLTKIFSLNLMMFFAPRNFETSAAWIG